MDKHQAMSMLKFIADLYAIVVSPDPPVSTPDFEIVPPKKGS